MLVGLGTERGHMAKFRFLSRKVVRERIKKLAQRRERLDERYEKICTKLYHKTLKIRSCCEHKEHKILDNINRTRVCTDCGLVR